MKNYTYEILPIQVDVKSNLQSINFYLVKTDYSLILVDAGVDKDQYYEALINKLRENDLTITDITEIVLTHNHIDHVGLVNKILKEHHVPVYAHEDAIPRLKRDPDFFNMRLAFFEKLYEEMGCGESGKKQVIRLKETMEKNQNKGLQAEITPIKPYHFGFKTIHTPGHAQDHIVLFHEHTGELIAGDVLIKHISTNAIVEPNINGERLHTLVQHKHSMEKLIELPITKTYSGHGDVIEDTKQLINRRLEGIDRKAKNIKNLITTKQLTAAEIAKLYYKKVYHEQFSLVMSEIIGHLDYLEREKEITKTQVNGVWYYKAV